MYGPTIPQPRHIGGLTKAKTINTDGFRGIQLDLATSGGRSGLYVVDGAPGVGKTFAVSTYLAEHEISACWADMPDTPKGKEATQRIYRAVTGSQPSHRITEFELTERTVEALSESSAALVIDEAQNLTRSALKQVRYLLDRQTTRTPIILIGSGIQTVIANVPELLSRVARYRPVLPIPTSSTLDLISSFHPVFSGPDPEALATLHRYARGNLRRWARIAEVCESYEIDFITKETAELILSQISPTKMGGNQ